MYTIQFQKKRVHGYKRGQETCSDIFHQQYITSRGADIHQLKMKSIIFFAFFLAFGNAAPRFRARLNWPLLQEDAASNSKKTTYDGLVDAMALVMARSVLDGQGDAKDLLMAALQSVDQDTAHLNRLRLNLPSSLRTELGGYLNDVSSRFIDRVLNRGSNTPDIAHQQFLPSSLRTELVDYLNDDGASTLIDRVLNGRSDGNSNTQEK